MFSLRKVNETLRENVEEQRATRTGVNNVVDILQEQLDIQKSEALQRREDAIESKRSRGALIAGAGAGVASAGLYQGEGMAGEQTGTGILGGLKFGAALAAGAAATRAVTGGARRLIGGGRGDGRAEAASRRAEARRLFLAQEAERQIRAGQTESERFARTAENLETSRRAGVVDSEAQAKRTTDLINDYYRGSDSPEARQLAADQRIRIANQIATRNTLRRLQNINAGPLDTAPKVPSLDITQPEIPTADTSPKLAPAGVDTAPATGPLIKTIAPNADEIFKALGATKAPTKGPLIDMIDAPESKMALQQLEADLGVKYHATEDGKIIARRPNGQILKAAEFDKAINSLKNVQAKPVGRVNPTKLAFGGLVAADLAVSGLYGAGEAIEEGRTTRGDVTAGGIAGVATAPADLFAFGANSLASGLEYMFPNYFANKPSQRLDFSGLRQDISRSGGGVLSQVPLLDEQASETTVNSIVKANNAVQNAFEAIGENISSAFDQSKEPTSPYSALTQQDYLNMALPGGANPPVVQNFYNYMQPQSENGNAESVVLLPDAPVIDIRDPYYTNVN